MAGKKWEQRRDKERNSYLICMSEKHRDECRKYRMERFWCLCSAARVLGRGFPSRGRRCLGGTHLLAVLAHVGEDLRERAHGVELIHVHPGLLGQVCIHVLVADGWHLPDVRIIPAGMGGEERGWSGARGAEGRGTPPALSGPAIPVCDPWGPRRVLSRLGCGVCPGEPSAALDARGTEAGMWGVDRHRQRVHRGRTRRKEGLFSALVLPPSRSSKSLMSPWHALPYT